MRGQTFCVVSAVATIGGRSIWKSFSSPLATSAQTMPIILAKDARSVVGGTLRRFLSARCTGSHLPLGFSFLSSTCTY